MMKTVASITAFSLVMGVSAIAAAQQNPNCPPGSWFCADAQLPGLGSAQITIGGGNQTQLQPLPPPQQQQTVIVPEQHMTPEQPPVVVYQPAPPPVVVVRPMMQPPPDYRTYYVRRQVMLPPHEWGLNLRLDGAFIGGGSNNPGNGGLGGFGAGLRYKLSPWFGVEAGADFLIGRDYNDYARNETAFTLNGMLFLNPRSRAQVYILAGFGYSIANVTNDTYGSGVQPVAYNNSVTYNYFGGQAGLGLEYRLTRNLAVNIDLRGFVRGRTDGNASSSPEFIDPSTGRTTNTSGGLLATGGLTFYF
jgi:opacity protein-like surface antigen